MSLMSASLSPHPSLSLLLTTHRRPITRFSLRTPYLLRLPSAVATTSSVTSWLTPAADDDLRGWHIPSPAAAAAAAAAAPIPNKPSGFRIVLVAGIGTSVAVVLAAVAHFSMTKRGFSLPFRSSPSSLPVPVAIEAEEFTTDDFDAATGEQQHQAAAGEQQHQEMVVESKAVESPMLATELPASEKLQPRIITVTVDSTQQEAVNVLKKLKIMDEDVKSDELCTRRDYARWLIRASSLLERNPKYKLNSAVALAGSLISAYEDVTTGDQDFDYIQALAEAGVVSSKLSSKHTINGVYDFDPESFLSRRDLIDWRAQLEYDYSTTGTQEILKQKLDLLDVREISSNEGPGLFMDMRAGDESLLRRVFGQIRRLQPNRPSTIAQAAVALTSGRMSEAIRNELLRLEAEESSRSVTKAEIKQELLDRGDIVTYWALKMEEEKARGLELQQFYMDALNKLEQEKIVQESAYNGFLKEKAALECQKQLLNGLKEEVNEMSERLLLERAQQSAEEETVQTLHCELQIKKEGVVDAKSVLEAEIEALRILRSWIEDEARKSEARAKVLEEVGRRWKCDGQY